MRQTEYYLVNFQINLFLSKHQILMTLISTNLFFGIFGIFYGISLENFSKMLKFKEFFQKFPNRLSKDDSRVYYRFNVRSHYSWLVKQCWIKFATWSNFYWRFYKHVTYHQEWLDVPLLDVYVYTSACTYSARNAFILHTHLSEYIYILTHITDISKRLSEQHTCTVKLDPLTYPRVTVKR